VPVLDVDDEQELRQAAAVEAARLSPARMAAVCSNSAYQWLPHARVLDDAILTTLTQPEGRLIVSMTVRAGKSTTCSRWLPAWYLGHHPDQRVGLACHEAGLAREHSGAARTIFNEWGPRIFGLGVDPGSRARHRWDVAEHAGGMLSFGVGGVPTGRGFGLLLIDDPIKDWRQAQNADQRRYINEEWWQGSIAHRVEAGGHVVVICSRWHEDDLSGFLKREFPGDWTELRLPAICDDPEHDPLGRQLGESYWPEKWPVELLEARRRTVGERVWLAQFQGRPTGDIGEVFPTDRLQWVDRSVLARTDIRWCRGWDLAATEGDGDYTAGGLIGRYPDGRWVIADMVRGQWAEGTVRQKLIDQAAQDRPGTMIELPQDPGQAGKPVSVNASVAMGDGSHMPLGAVTVGDMVITKEGRPRRVLAVHDQGNLPGVRVTTKSGRCVEAALDHPFLTPTGWVDAGDLIVGGHLGVPNGYLTCSSDEARPPEEARLIGYFLGDGCCVINQRNSLASEIVVADLGELADIEACAARLGFRHLTRRVDGKDMWRVALSGGAREWLRSTGLAGHDAFTKRIPSWAFRQPDDYIEHLVGAYFACDGSIDRAGKSAELYSVNRWLLRDVQRLLTRLGIWSELRSKNGRYLDSRHQSWRLYIPVRKGSALRRFILRVPVLNGAKMARMAAVVGAPTEFDPTVIADRIEEIERVEVECRCLTVEEDASFLAEELVVHNSQAAQLIASLSGHLAEARPQSGDKVTRAGGLGAQVQAGNVDVVRDSDERRWNRLMVEEMDTFPNGLHDDQVDALAVAFNRIAQVPEGEGMGLDAFSGLRRQ
jgi:predicted phage terminase large subunit-like protein